MLGCEGSTPRVVVVSLAAVERAGGWVGLGGGVVEGDDGGGGGGEGQVRRCALEEEVMLPDMCKCECECVVVGVGVGVVVGVGVGVGVGGSVFCGSVDKNISPTQFPFLSMPRRMRSLVCMCARASWSRM